MFPLPPALPDPPGGRTPPGRRSVTPGTLYRILREDFDASRPGGCSCRMPMIFGKERASGDEANWELEPLAGCAACRALARDVAARHAAAYELVEADFGGRRAPVGADRLAAGQP